MPNKRKIVVIGLDCATPKTLFEDFIDDCPNIKNLLNHGVYGKLKSSDPPITIPAWMVLSTGKKPGTLGIYGFRHRKGNSYTDYWIANSRVIKEPKIWDFIGKKGLKSIIVGVTPTFPVEPLNGNLIAGFMTPNVLSNYTYPPFLKFELFDKVGDYIIDVNYRAVNFRTNSKEQLLIDLHEMTNIQFKTIRYLMKTKEWDYTQFVIIGLDRIHHAFWKFYDKTHPRYEPGNIFESAMKNYYKKLDKEIGEILELIDKNTIVFIVSDHGAKAMKGCLCVNLALEQLGLLKFKTRPTKKTRLEDAEIDWENTYAWGWGGHYARIFLNVKGREEFGIIESKDYEEWRDKVRKLLKGVLDDQGNQMNTKIYKPEELFHVINGDAPDLMVYFDDLNWRSAGTVGYKTIYLDENDIGPDNAVHDYFGVFIIYDPTKKIGKQIEDLNILDIAPTILDLFGLEIPEDMEGNIIEF